MKNFVEIGRHKIEVNISNGIRMVKYSDTKELLGLKDDEVNDCFIDAGILTDTLFKKIYITKDATKEQEIIHQGLCIVGIYCVIDEACGVDLKNISYVKEFEQNFKKALNYNTAINYDEKDTLSNSKIENKK